MIDIHIDKHYKLTSSTNNFTLEKKQMIKSGEKAGEFAYAVVGYYPTIPVALHGYMTHKTRGCNAKNIDELVVVLKSIRSLLNKIRAKLELV